MKAALKEAVSLIRRAGFSHIKVELEGQLNRRNSRGCGECGGDGYTRCDYCGGEGYTEDENEENSVACDECLGDGDIICSDCEGQGNNNQYNDEDQCQEFILDYVSRILNKKPIREAARNYGSNVEAIPHLNYGRFYYDGSVDSEFTFTIPIEYVEDLIHYVQAFIELGSVCGNGEIDVRGAGMHISVLPDGCRGSYPTQVRMSPTKLANFTSEVSKLLPALFFVGTAGNRSRPLEYRAPKISSSKYSAICTHNGTALEYRVFETCYYRPEAIFDFVQVIAQSLKFYADPKLKVKALGKRFGFPSSVNIAKYYSTPEQLRILNATIKHLKPLDKSFKELKKERGLYYTVSSLQKKDKTRIALLRREYQELKKHHEQMKKRALEGNELRYRDDYMIERNISIEEAEEIVKEKRAGTLVPFNRFLQDNLTGIRLYQTITV